MNFFISVFVGIPLTFFCTFILIGIGNMFQLWRVLPERTVIVYTFFGRVVGQVNDLLARQPEVAGVFAQVGSTAASSFLGGGGGGGGGADLRQGTVTAMLDPDRLRAPIDRKRSNIVKHLARHPGRQHADDRHALAGLRHAEVGRVDKVVARNIAQILKLCDRILGDRHAG